MLSIRSRDQLWQLGLVAGAATLVLFLAAVLALRSGGEANTEAVGGFTVADDLLGDGAGSPNGPSASEGDGQGASGGLLDGRSTTTAVTTVAPEPTPLTSVAPSTETTVAPPTEASTTVTETTDPETTTTTTEPVTTETTVPETTTSTEPTDTTSETIGTVLPPTTMPDNSAVRQDLAAARQRWQSMGFDSYSMTVTRSCFCAPGTTGPFEVVVRRGTVQSVTPLNGQGMTLDPQSLTVPGLFNQIESALGADSIQVTFDQTNGVPLRTTIDNTIGAVDDELSFSVANFQPHRGD